MLVSSLPSLIINFPHLEGFSGGSAGKESACNAGNLSSIPGSGRSPGEGMETHSSILAWRIIWTEDPGGLHTVHGVAKNQTCLSH